MSYICIGEDIALTTRLSPLYGHNIFFMKKIALLALALYGMVSLASAQNRIEVSTGDFKDINITGEVQVNLVRGEHPGISAEIINSSTDKLEYFVKKEELFIRMKQPFAATKESRGQAVVTVTYKDLRSITSDGATILSPGVIESDVIAITTIAQGNINLNMACRDVEVTATNSVVTIGGDTEYLNIKAMAGASVNAIAMSSDNVNATANTTAECFVNAKIRLEAKAATKGKVFYKEDPEILKTDKSTLGKIEKIGGTAPF